MEATRGGAVEGTQVTTFVRAADGKGRKSRRSANRVEDLSAVTFVRAHCKGEWTQVKERGRNMDHTGKLEDWGRRAEMPSALERFCVR